MSNPAAPSFLGFLTSGVTAIDHNLYVPSNKILEANYRSGLRAFDNTAPAAPTVYGFFDTYEPDDGDAQLLAQGRALRAGRRGCDPGGRGRARPRTLKS